jgi:hypothetical protein
MAQYSVGAVSGDDVGLSLTSPFFPLFFPFVSLAIRSCWGRMHCRSRLPEVHTFLFDVVFRFAKENMLETKQMAMNKQAREFVQPTAERLLQSARSKEYEEERQREDATQTRRMRGCGVTMDA